MRRIILIICISLSLVVCGCRGDKMADIYNDNGVEIINIDGLSSNITLNLSDIYSEIEYIPLESTEASQVGRIESLESTKNGEFLVFDKRNGKVVLFDENGKYLNNIGCRGHGPAEYLSPEIVRYNAFTNQVIIYDGMKHALLHYNMGGELVSNTTLHKYIRNFGVIDSTHYAIYANHFDKVSTDETAYNLEIINNEGHVLKQFEPYNADKMNFNPPANYVFWQNDGKLLYIKPYYSYVYFVTKDKIAPLFHIDYGTEQFSVEWLDNCVSVDDIENKMAENKYSDLWFFGESSNKYYMEINYANDALLTVVVDKREGHNINMGDILNNDILGLVSSMPMHIANDKVYGVIDPDEFCKFEEKLGNPQICQSFCDDYKKVNGYTISDKDKYVVKTLSKSLNPIIQVCLLK